MKPIDFSYLTTMDLLGLHARSANELRERGITRTANNPTGDYAELLFATAFKWTLNDNSASDFDAVGPLGTRYQIKCRRLSARNGSRQLSFIRRLPEQRFDQLAAVLLDDEYRVTMAALIPHAVVVERAAYVSSVNGWRFRFTDSVMSVDGVVDVTQQLREAQSSI